MTISLRSGLLLTTTAITLFVLPYSAQAQLRTSVDDGAQQRCGGIATCFTGTNIPAGAISVAGPTFSLLNTDPEIIVDSDTALSHGQGISENANNIFISVENNVTNTTTNGFGLEITAFGDTEASGTADAVVSIADNISLHSIQIGSNTDILASGPSTDGILLGTGANIPNGINVEGEISATGGGNAVDFSAADAGLTITVDSRAILVGDVVLGEGDTITFDDETASSQTFTYGDDIIGDIGGGTETFNVDMGANDVFTMNGDVTNINNITVSSGTLNWQGTSSGVDSFLVNSGATLKGTSTITSGTVTNNGTYAPGNSIGTQNIMGDFVQGAGGKLEIEFDGSGIDLVDITGTANLNGEVELIELGAGADVNLPLTFLQAAGGVTGTFSTTTKTLLIGSALADASVGYDATSAFLTFASTSGVNSTAPSNQGGSKVATAINADATNNPTTATADIINAINGASDVDAALDSQGNIVANTLTTQANGALGQVVNVVRARLASNSVNTIETGISSGDGYNRWIDEATYWTQAVGAVSDIDGDSNARGSESVAYGAALGLEYPFDSRTTLGAFAGYTRSETDVDGLADESEVNNYQIGLYGAHEFDNNWNFHGTLSASYLQFDTSRPTTTGIATADFDGYGGYSTGEVSYDIDTKYDIVVTPYAALEASVIKREDYLESGAGVLNNDVNDETSEYLTSVIGTKISGYYEVGSDLQYLVRPTARIGWAHQYLDNSATTTASFANAPTAVFETQGPERDRDSVRLGLDLELAHSDNDAVSSFIRYDGDIARDAQDHMIRVGAGFKF